MSRLSRRELKGRERLTFSTTPPWTVEDDARLLVFLPASGHGWGLMPVPRACGERSESIARRLKRTSAAVHNRYRYLYKLWLQGKKR